MPKTKTRGSTLTSVSISKQQAEALAEGFLDSIGSGKEGLRPKGVYSESILLAGEFIQDCQDNLIRSNSVASGKLSESLVAGEPTLEGNTLKIDVLMNFYGKFVNKGVKGTRAGASAAGYSFKYDNPSKKMVKAIKAWIDRGKISTRTVEKYKPHGAHERKNRKLSLLSKADAAYAVARSIKLGGIKKTGFVDKAVLTTTQKVADRLGVALRIDVTDFLNNL